MEGSQDLRTAAISLEEGLCENQAEGKKSFQLMLACQHGIFLDLTGGLQDGVRSHAGVGRGGDRS